MHIQLSCTSSLTAPASLTPLCIRNVSLLTPLARLYVSYPLSRVDQLPPATRSELYRGSDKFDFPCGLKPPRVEAAAEINLCESLDPVLPWWLVECSR